MDKHQIKALQECINEMLVGEPKLDPDGEWGSLTSGAFDKTIGLGKSIIKENIPFVFVNEDGGALNKDNWFNLNKKSIKLMVDQINGENDYGNCLYYEDAFAVMYAEIAIDKNGNLNPSAIHSEGEYGLFPLPEVLGYFVGDETAPRPADKISTVRNIYWFLRYMHSLKNKDLGATLMIGSVVTKLYYGLWYYKSIGASPKLSANLLAAVVHGYFYSRNFTGSSKTYSEILNRIANGLPADQVVKGTSYIHAGKPMMVGRAVNIKKGLSFV
jgi:hypothetical protein